MTDYFITGVSSGIGQGLARELARRGHRIWGVARREKRLAELARELGADRFLFSVCDVSRSEDVRATTREMERAGFLPEVVILNAGINPEQWGSGFTLEEFEEVVRVNLFGALAWVEVFLATFRSRGRGQFVGISSLAAYRGDARWVAYCASKAALSRAFEAFRGRHAREGVSFTTVHLGSVNTGMGLRSRSPFRLSEEQAVRRILAAMERRAHSVTIPRSLRLMMELMRILPDPLFSRLIGRAFAEPGEERAEPTVSARPKGDG